MLQMKNRIMSAWRAMLDPQELGREKARAAKLSVELNDADSAIAVMRQEINNLLTSHGICKFDPDIRVDIGADAYRVVVFEPMAYRVVLSHLEAKDKDLLRRSIRILADHWRDAWVVRWIKEIAQC
jgi:hypothetical protein